MSARADALTVSGVMLLALGGLLLLGVSCDLLAQDVAPMPSESRPPDLVARSQGRETGLYASSSPYTVTVWHGWYGGYTQEYYRIMDEFNATHPTMAVELVYQQDMSNALSQAVPAGEGPDVVAWNHDLIGTLALADYLVPLDPWIDRSYLDSTFEPAAARGMIWRDQIWGIPVAQEGIALVYNRALISDTLLPDPANFEDLLVRAAQFQQMNPGLYYVCNQGLGNPDAYHAAPIYLGHGLKDYGGYVDEDGHAYLTTSAAISAAQWISDFRPYAPAQTSHDICRHMLIAGEAGAWWTGSWALPDLDAAGIDYGIAPMGSPFVSLRNLMMTRNAVDRGNADMAVYVMQHLASMEVQKRVTLASHAIPANTAALNDPDVQALHAVAAFGASLHLGTPMANFPYAGCQWGPVGDATTALWTRVQTPQEAMNTAQATILECIASMNGASHHTYLPLLVKNHASLQ